MRPIFEPEGQFRRGSIGRIYDFFVSRGAIEPIPDFDPDSLIDESIEAGVAVADHQPSRNARGEGEYSERRF